MKNLIFILTKEFQDFKKKNIRSTTEFVFNNYYKIYFFNELYHYILNCQSNNMKKILLKMLQKDNNLEFLYSEFLKNEFYSVNNVDDIEDFLLNLYEIIMY